MIYLVIYLWLLNFIACLVMGTLVASPRTGFDLMWRCALAPVLIPFLIVARIVKGNRQ